MKKVFTAKDNKEYVLLIDDKGEHVIVQFESIELGYIKLEYVKSSYKGPPEHYYITSLEMSKCKRVGLGEAALRFHKESFSLPLVAAEEGSKKLSDGSHLIDDGIPFIRRMREKGIVCPESEKTL